MSTTPFAADARMVPYWWDHVPRPHLPDVALPPEVDVLVVGSGYTGLHAALQTARAGRSTLVLDAEDAGWGCSTRNGGQVSTSIKPGFAELARRHGEARSREIMREGQRSLQWLGEFITDEGIDCDWGVVGRFHAAHNARQFELLAHAATHQAPGLEVPAEVVPRAEQRREIGTEAYWGGVLYPAHASVDPARYHQGLLQRAQAAGATVVPRCAVNRIERGGTQRTAGHLVHTARGTVRARDVVVATNGYTGPLTPWLRRRVIPIGSYIIATEPLAPGVIERLIPRNRIVSDTRRVVYYYRASPDRQRILFGGRVSTDETDPRVSGPLLHADLAALFPELAAARISHSWAGFVAYTFDTLAHVGCHDGVHYAMGYCGSGVGMGSYLGMRIGQQVLGRAEGRTAFDELPFQTRPLYTGRPWFLAASVRWYRWLDSRGV
ncbi:MAG: FAD-binding oxidoreductase [Rubrivivax sp.]|nr:FAD-binding oxidoreductase [Rubrivivax sp.]